MSRTVIEDRALVPTKFQPYDDYVLLQHRGDNERTSGGIWVARGERTECFLGKVLAVGPGPVNPETGEHYAMPIKKGEWLISMKYQGGHMKLEGVEYRLVREHGIWCKVEGEERGERFEIARVIPYGERIVVRLIDQDRTRSGLFLGTNHPNVKYAIAEVLAVGPGLRSIKTGRVDPIQARPKERVVMYRYHGAELRVLGEELRVIQEEDVLAVIEGDVREIA